MKKLWSFLKWSWAKIDLGTLIFAYFLSIGIILFIIGVVLAIRILVPLGVLIILGTMGIGAIMQVFILPQWRRFNFEQQQMVDTLKDE